ncbi:MAG: hypothetical protein RIA69_02345 [Cyclobacteriaceae bacterium]
MEIKDAAVYFNNKSVLYMLADSIKWSKRLFKADFKNQNINPIIIIPAHKGISFRENKDYILQ